MANVIGTFSSEYRHDNGKPIIFTIYDNYTYHCSDWEPTRGLTSFQVKGNDVWIKHFSDSMFVKVHRSIPEHIKFVDQVLLIIGEHVMLTGD